MRPPVIDEAPKRPRKALVCAAFATLILGVASESFAAGVTFVSAGTVGTSLGHFSYHGRWEHMRKMRDGRLFGSSSRTSSLGADVTLTFVGSMVRIYGVRGPGGGHGVLLLDSKRFPDIDFYAARKEVRAVIFTSPILRYGFHTLAIAAIADARTKGRKSSYINFSGAAYR